MLELEMAFGSGRPFDDLDDENDEYGDAEEIVGSTGFGDDDFKVEKSYSENDELSPAEDNWRHNALLSDSSHERAVVIKAGTAAGVASILDGVEHAAERGDDSQGGEGLAGGPLSVNVQVVMAQVGPVTLGDLEVAAAAGARVIHTFGVPTVADAESDPRAPGMLGDRSSVKTHKGPPPAGPPTSAAALLIGKAKAAARKRVAGLGQRRAVALEAARLGIQVRAFETVQGLVDDLFAVETPDPAQFRLRR